MPDDEVEELYPAYPPPRRLGMFFKLIEEGLIADKPPKQVTASDIDQIDSRLLLEDLAAKEGVSVEQLFDGWEEDLQVATGPLSTREMMEWLLEGTGIEVDETIFATKHKDDH